MSTTYNKARRFSLTMQHQSLRWHRKRQMLKKVRNHEIIFFCNSSTYHIRIYHTFSQTLLMIYQFCCCCCFSIQFTLLSVRGQDQKHQPMVPYSDSLCHTVGMTGRTSLRNVGPALATVGALIKMAKGRLIPWFASSILSACKTPGK